MNYLDLSHLIAKGMSVYPGDNSPEIKRVHQVNLDGYRQTSLLIQSHIGTHIDAPAHILDNGKYLNGFPLSYFTGRAVILFIPNGIERISKEFLQKFEEDINDSQFVLLNTGWGQYWGTDKYYEDFPVLDNEAADYLAGFTITGVGMDTPSADPVSSTELQNHKILLSEEIILIENLYFPEELEGDRGEFFCFPLPYSDADGSPIRAVLKVD